MSEVSKKVAEMLLSTKSIAVYKDKPFVFVSGRISPVYIDCRKLLSFAARARVHRHGAGENGGNRHRLG